MESVQVHYKDVPVGGLKPLDANNFKRGTPNPKSFLVLEIYFIHPVILFNDEITFQIRTKVAEISPANSCMGGSMTNKKTTIARKLLFRIECLELTHVINTSPLVCDY